MATKKKNYVITWILIILILVATYVAISEEIYPTTTDSQLSTSPVLTVLSQTTAANQSYQSSSTDWYELYFTNPKIPFDNNFEGGIEDKIIEKIDESTQSIDVAIFELDIDSVTSALIGAHERGVVVRVVYDNEYTEGDPQIDKLIKSGIKATADNRSGLMHNKFFVFDDKCIWTGSFNITMNAAYRNNENAIYFCSQEAALNYGTEFDEMFAGKFGSTSPSDTPYPIITIDGKKIENYFASEDEVMNKVINTVKEAKSTIHFMAYSFTDDTLGQTMIDKTGEGVIVEGIFETIGAKSKYSECDTLLTKGYDIRLDGNPKTFHHKVIIIDSSIVILGSFNFSANADNQNDENILIVYDTRLAKAYEQEYQLMKSQSVIPVGNTCSK